MHNYLTYDGTWMNDCGGMNKARAFSRCSIVFVLHQNTCTIGDSVSLLSKFPIDTVQILAYQVKYMHIYTYIGVERERERRGSEVEKSCRRERVLRAEKSGLRLWRSEDDDIGFTKVGCLCWCGLSTPRYKDYSKN